MEGDDGEREQSPDSEAVIFEEDLTELADLDDDDRPPEDGEDMTQSFTRPWILDMLGRDLPCGVCTSLGCAV